VTVLLTERASFAVDRARRATVIRLDLGLKGSWRPVHSEPHEQAKGYSAEAEAAYRVSAEQAGHADLFEASLAHDLAHQLIWEAFGLRAAPSLMLAALGRSCRRCGCPVQRLVPGQVALDDALAFAVQRAANGLDWDRETLWWLKPEAVEALACRLKALLREAGL
jgi:hypothetical protein